MGLIMQYDDPIDGYESVPLVFAGDQHGVQDGDIAVLRRRTARPSKRAVVYVHCLDDSFVPADIVGWYTNRGFHFYAADLREVGATGWSAQDGNRAAEDLSECIAFLDAAIAHVRETEAIETVVMCAHAAGALVAALWCHARRDQRGADALVLASPDLGSGMSWLPRVRGMRGAGAAARRSPSLLGSAQRRIRHGLEISCPVLVMCPAGSWDIPGGSGGLLAARALSGGRVITRLGEHVTWLKLEGGLPGQPLPEGPQRRRFFDELSRWLGAYLSGQIRDQLL